MIAGRITPKWIWTGMVLNLGLWLMLHLPAYLGLIPHYLQAEGGLRTAALSIAYALALVLNLEVAREYLNAPWLRLAWLALAGNAVFSIVRMIIESTLLLHIYPGYPGSPLAGLLQHLAIVPANAFLLLGLLSMLWAYHQLGLGFTIKWRDYLAIAGIFALLAALLWFRQGLSEARSPFVAARILQQSGLVMLSFAAAVSLILDRIANQMGGGKLALTLRFLTLYTLMRGVLVLMQALFRLMSPGLNDPLSLVSMVLDICWQAVPWFAALAAAYRAEMTQHAARELAQHRASRAAMAS
ncbi:MAG: hypothetical protein IPL01_24085 [Acidobacteria bacterium]|nr:hypothetical protein [Acidobacteriota bacterium]